MKRFLRWVLTPVFRRLAKWYEGDDPWERFPYRVPLHTLGRGSYHPFPWYFEGESGVRVTTIEDLCDWLLDCEYAHDKHLFNEADFWQHPRTFEHLRKGDCEDHAIWAWRKLVELGIEAELVSGEWNPPGDTPGGHVWVRFRKDGQEFIRESVGGSRSRMIRPFSEAKSEYIVGIKGVAWYLAGIIELLGLIPYMMLGGVHGPLSEGQGVAVVSIVSGCVWAAPVPLVRIPSRRKRRRVGSTAYRSVYLFSFLEWTH
ncbi:MAG TPA: hypothetical protein VFT29_10610 [Gemmatimonadaceae bacterium]|nr:hypothetical protein [Gemmatimonadaceae bacterium]